VVHPNHHPNGFETSTTAARGVRHVAQDKPMPAIAITLRRWITLSPDCSISPQSGRCASSARQVRFSPDRSRLCLHNESRQRKSRTCQQTCSLPIAEVRVAALFRRTLNPVVLQSRNLETSFPRKRQVLLQYLLAHTAPISNGDSRTIRDVGYCIMLVFCVPEARFGVRTQDGRIK
jgi:hypothetical protein